MVKTRTLQQAKALLKECRGSVAHAQMKLDQGRSLLADLEEEVVKLRTTHKMTDAEIEKELTQIEDDAEKYLQKMYDKEEQTGVDPNVAFLHDMVETAIAKQFDHDPDPMENFNEDIDPNGFWIKMVDGQTYNITITKKRE